MQSPVTANRQSWYDAFNHSTASFIYNVSYDWDRISRKGLSQLILNSGGFHQAHTTEGVESTFLPSDRVGQLYVRNDIDL